SLWNIGFNVNNNITPGNTVFDIAFTTNNGIIGGIYNSGVATSTANTYPDIATLVLQISDPNPWNFSDVGDDSILRTQRTGANGNGSDKIVTSSSSTSTSGGTSTSSTSGGTSTSSTSGGTTTSSTSGGTSNGNTVSEPGVLALLGIGLLGQALMFVARRRRLGSK
ncbi:MAG TPA: PEP-CTERM sorting domain-containing protein, partial [Nitrosomonas sp.]|nr:PEP-CTERM sorting domain-containing protein [Nitrosomonas sp.]HNM73390.1 PEP-CTERM sorting domain-containing protein [Nitrosomonas sp.]